MKNTMDLATPLLAADATPPRARSQATATADAPCSFAATMQQLGAGGDTAGTLDTAGNASGNDAPRDGKPLPLSLDATASKVATASPLVTVTEDDIALVVQPGPITPTANIGAKGTPMPESGAKDAAALATVSLPQRLTHADTLETAPPVATSAVPTATSVLDRKDKVAAADPPDTAPATVAENGKPETDTVETLAITVNAPPTQEPTSTDAPAPQTPPAPVTADPATATVHVKPPATTAPSSSMTDTLPLSTDRSTAPITVGQTSTATSGATPSITPGATTAAPELAPRPTADTDKALADTGKTFAIPPAPDTFTSSGNTAGTNTGTTGQDASTLLQAPQSAPPTHASTPPPTMLAAALLANGAPPAGNVAPGYTPAFMGSPAWLDAMDAQVNWMQDKGIADAELKLHPAELGALEISISVQDDKAVVRMVAGTAQARDLLEASLPRLRDMFAANGMQLAHGSVAQGDSQGRQHAPAPRGAPLRDEPATPQAPPRSATLRAASLHRIDHYV